MIVVSSFEINPLKGERPIGRPLSELEPVPEGTFTDAVLF
jgi:hypothetical protein